MPAFAIPSFFRPRPAPAASAADESIDLLRDMPPSDDPVYAARDEIRASVQVVFDNVAAQRAAVVEEALTDLDSGIARLSELGVEGSDEFLELVDEYLLDVPDDKLSEIDRGLAHIDWSGTIAQNLRRMNAKVKEVRTNRAMPDANEAPSENARWKREHRDIGLQLKWLSKPFTDQNTLCKAASLLPRMLRSDAAAHDEQFGAHVDLLLNGWSNDRLVCLQYNVNSLREAWTKSLDHPDAPVPEGLELLKDPELGRHLAIVNLALSDMLAKRNIDEPCPERVMLRAADNIADLSVLAQWLREGRVSDGDVAAAFGKWSSGTLKEIVRKFDRAIPGLYQPLVLQAQSVLSAREAVAAQRAAAGGAQRPEPGDYRHFVDDDQAPPANPPDAPAGSVSRYTTWGGRYSVGALLNTGLRWLTLSEPARRLGNWIQHGHASGLLYTAGAVVKGFANITGAACGVAASAVSVVEALAVNVVGGVFRAVAAAGLGIAAAAAKIGGLASPAADRAGDRIAGAAKELVGGISLVSKKPAQVEIPPHLIDRATDLAKLARITGSTTEARNEPLPPGFSRANRGDIPVELLSREAGGTGSATKLRLDPQTGLLTGDRWSGLKVGVYVETDAQGNGVAYHLSFVGTQSGRPATLKSDAAQSFFGIEDSAFQEADAIVKAFVARHGAAKVKLQGHSLGGALAQWAAIRNSGGDHPVAATCFNAAGLHLNLRNKLGEDLIARADIVHINTGKDVLSQVMEGARSPILGTQVGRRFLVPGSGGHSLRHHLAGLERVPAQTATRHALPLALVKEAVSIRRDQPMTPFGQGSTSEVFRAVGTMPDGTVISGVYKKDGDDVPNAALRSLATSKLDQRLALGVIARTQLVVGAGQVGSIMEFAKGSPPNYLGNRIVEVSDEVAAVFRKTPALLDDFAKSKGFQGGTIDGLTITMINERARDPDDESAGISELVSFNGAAFGADPNLWRQVTDLQWLDALTGQRDRHAGNYFVSRDLNGIARVTGIDNDLAFGADLQNPEARPSHEAPLLPRLIDIRTAKALLSLTPAQIDEDCAGLSDAEIAATKARLSVIQERIRSFAPDSGAGQVLGEDADWTDQEYAGALGISAFEGNAAKKGIDYMIQEAARSSYVAREMAPYAANRLGAKMPILDAGELAAAARGKLALRAEAEELS